MNIKQNQFVLETLNLGYDETDHIKIIDEKVMGRIILAENAAIITIGGLTNLKERLYLDEPEGIINLLMIKSAKNIRFATKGLKLGYYAGASTILRSAYEDLSFAVLFHLRPDQLPKWLRNESSDIPFKEIKSFRAQQKSEAKQVIYSEEKDSLIIKDAINQYIKKANKHVHPSLYGLSEEFGIEADYFISDELDKMLIESKGNIAKALDKYVRQTSMKDYKPFKRSVREKAEGEKIEIKLPIRYDKALLSDLALFAFYISHRLLDYTKLIFIQIIKDNEFLLNYQSWHEDNKKLD
jgi:hypothetical protein